MLARRGEQNCMGGVFPLSYVWRWVMNLKVVLEPSDEGGYTVLVPSLPGCISEGDTKDEALKEYPRGHRTVFGAG